MRACVRASVREIKWTRAPVELFGSCNHCFSEAAGEDNRAESHAGFPGTEAMLLPIKTSYKDNKSHHRTYIGCFKT